MKTCPFDWGSQFHEDYLMPIEDLIKKLKPYVPTTPPMSEYSEIDFKLLKEWLDHGDIKKLAADFGISAKYASAQLSAKPRKRRNRPFIMAAFELAIKNKAEVVQHNSRLRNIQES